MKICIIAEGSYPYVTGGVASWIQMLVTLNPEHEFIVYAIGACEEIRGRFKYDIPRNVIEVKEFFLDSYAKYSGGWGKRFNLTNEEKEALKGLIIGSGFRWGELFKLIEKSKYTCVSDFLMSRDFFDIITQVSEEYYPYMVFNDFFWTVRSMLLSLLEVLKNSIPYADIYHSVSTGYAGVVAALGKHKYGSPVVLSEHGIYTREREEEIIKSDWVKGYLKDIWIKYFYSLSSCAYTYADKVVSLFDRNKRIQIEMGCDKNKISIIPNGISSSDFIDIDRTKDNEEIINIGAVVRIVPIKDIKTIIQGFAIAAEKLKNIKLYILGPEDEDKTYTDECKLLVESLNLDNVTFTGQVNIKDYIGKMDILVLGSISEGQPLAVLEGMAAGKPHILTDVGSCRELMYGNNDGFGEAGIVIPVMDYEALGASIVTLSKNKPLRDKLGKSAHKRVSKLYTIDNFISGYKRIYEEVVRNK
ncbi:MAG: GT4 family glycosyltransferase PelF [Bacillota bacterium]|nr:GT4 family glycosyltransferase PelF [Bacillota bacterium]